MTNMTPYEFDIMNRQHGNEVSQTKEEAMRLLYKLVHARIDGTDADFLDAIHEAEEFIGYDNPSLFTIKVIAEEWRSSWDGPDVHEPRELSFVMEKRDVLSHWSGQTVWLEPEMNDNFAATFDGPYGRFAQEVLDGIYEKHDIRVMAYSHMSIDKEYKDG